MSNKKTDKQFEDLGWNKMNAILDLEMPRKKRRGFLFYWPLFVGVAGALFAVWYSKESQKEVKPIEKQITQPIAQLDHKSKENSNKKNVDKIKQIENNEIANNSSAQNRNNKSEIKSHVYFNNTNEKFPKTSKVNQFNSSQSKKSFIDYNDEPDNYLKETNEVVVSSSKVWWKNDEMELPERVNLRLIEIIVDNQIPEVPYPLISTKKPTSSLNRFQFGVHSGVQLYPSNNLLGWVAGVHSEINLTRRWSLNLIPSLELRRGDFLLLNENEFEYVIENLDSLQMNSGLFSADKRDVIEFADANGKTNHIPITKYKNLFSFQLPVLIGYKLNKHWQMSFGMKFHIPLQKDISNASKSYVMHSNGNKTNIWKLNPVNYFIQAGIAYYPIHSIGISMDYSFQYSAFQKKESADLSTPSTALPGTNINTIKKDKLHHLSMKLNYRF